MNPENLAELITQYMKPLGLDQTAVTPEIYETLKQLAKSAILQGTSGGTLDTSSLPEEVANPWAEGAEGVKTPEVKEFDYNEEIGKLNFPDRYIKTKYPKNSHPVEPGDLVLIKNEAIALTVLSEDKSTTGVTYTISNGKSYPLEELYPYYVLNQNTAPRLGDLLTISSYKTPYGTVKDTKAVLITDKAQLEFISKHCTVDRIARYTDTKDSSIAGRVVFKQYACGKYEDINGKQYDELPNLRFIGEIQKVSGSLEIAQIAKHYNIPIEQVQPKEAKILKTVKTLLDAPASKALNEWVLLVGPSGSGKTTVAIEYAETHGLEYVLQQGSGQLAVADLLGWKSIVKFGADASNEDLYVPSLLRDAIENGKVFILDEIDACNPNTLLCLNSFKFDKVQFPDKLVQVHPNFRFIATANTLNYSEDYNGRSPLDRATVKRFAIVYYAMNNYEVALRYGLEATKSLSLTDKMPYSASDYDCDENFVLTPIRDLDPRDVQRIVKNKLIFKDTKGESDE